MNQEEFLRGYALLCKGYRQALDDGVAAVYFEVLKDFSADEFTAGVMRILRSSREFMPPPGVIAHDIAAASIGVRDAEEVVEEVFGLVRAYGLEGPFRDSASPAAIAVIDGYGWDVICDSKVDEHKILHAQLLGLARSCIARLVKENNLGRIGMGDQKQVEGRAP